MFLDGKTTYRVLRLNVLFSSIFLEFSDKPNGDRVKLIVPFFVSLCSDSSSFRFSFSFGLNQLNSKTMAKMAMARIKLLRNKREAVVRQMRRDIALLLQSGQDATARIRVNFLFLSFHPSPTPRFHL